MGKAHADEIKERELVMAILTIRRFENDPKSRKAFSDHLLRNMPQDVEVKKTVVKLHYFSTETADRVARKARKLGMTASVKI